jgi:hypothetical protein
MVEVVTEESGQDAQSSSTSATLSGEGAVEAKAETDRRRFCLSLGIGAVAVAIPYLWVLTDLWNSGPSLFRTVVGDHRLGNFYDLQGRAILAGHLYVPNGSLGEEAFIHNGHQYTYFGIFPSLIRLPVLLVTHSLDGKLTAISILLAWAVTAVASGAILWHCRVSLRGTANLRIAEAATYAILFAAILGGSALVNLAANPWVYSEDIAWSIALSLTAAIATIALLARPSWGRLTSFFLAVLAESLTRAPAGMAWSAGAVMVGAWLAWRRPADDSRPWWLLTMAAGVVSLLASFAISWLKFGTINSGPLKYQIWYSTHDAGVNHGHYFSPIYLPTGLSTYFGSLGVHFSNLFPFVTLPQYPVQGVGHVVLFGAEEMTSVPGSMPLLLLLTLVGLYGIVRRSSPLSIRLLAIPFVVAALPAALLLVFGFFDNRFVGDFVPVLVIGSAVGLPVVWQYMDRSGLAARRLAIAGMAALCAYSMVVNFGMSIVPTGWWSQQQTAAFVHAQQRVASIVGAPESSVVVHRDSLPKRGPVGQIVIIGRCKAVVFRPTTGLLPWIAFDSHSIRGGVSCQSLLPATHH